MTQPAWMAEEIASAAAAAPDEQQPVVREVVPGRIVHVDGDYLAYFAAGGSEMPVGIARRVAAERIQIFQEMSGACAAKVHLTAHGSTKGERFLAATVKPYQGQRAGQHPNNWAAIREYLESSHYSTFDRIIWTDREADDGFGWASYSARDPVSEVVIATADKDMRMLAGTHINWKDFTLVEVPKGTYETVGEYDGKVYGHKWFWLQMLHGDQADNIPGLPRAYGSLCGEKKAEALLRGTTCNEEAFEVIRKAYRAYYREQADDRIAEQASLLWMRGDAAASPIDFLRIVPLPGAAGRLLTRIQAQRAEIDSIVARANSQEAGS